MCFWLIGYDRIVWIFIGNEHLRSTWQRRQPSDDPTLYVSATTAIRKPNCTERADSTTELLATITKSNTGTKLENIMKVLFFHCFTFITFYIGEKWNFSASTNYVLCASTWYSDLRRSKSGRQTTVTSATEVPDKLFLQHANDDASEPNKLYIALLTIAISLSPLFLISVFN